MWFKGLQIAESAIVKPLDKFYWSTCVITAAVRAFVTWNVSSTGFASAIRGSAYKYIQVYLKTEFGQGTNDTSNEKNVIIYEKYLHTKTNSQIIHRQDCKTCR
jgi:hypothetical protein